VYPPSRKDFEWVFDLGYKDAATWCERQKQTRGEGKDGGKSEEDDLWWFHGADVSQWMFEPRPGGAFTRLFGYRTILKIIPSSLFDLVLGES
jgi:hypothetical protein